MWLESLPQLSLCSHQCPILPTWVPSAAVTPRGNQCSWEGRPGPTAHSRGPDLGWGSWLHSASGDSSHLSPAGDSRLPEGTQPSGHPALGLTPNPSLSAVCMSQSQRTCILVQSHRGCRRTSAGLGTQRVFPGHSVSGLWSFHSETPTHKPNHYQLPET